jgi:hypothetical protein
MKKVLTTIALAIIMVAGTNAQIKKPTIKVDASKVQTQQPSNGLLLKSSVNLKTLQDFNKLDIPTQQISKDKLDAKPTMSWAISPRKLTDGFLKFNSFKGDYDLDLWDWGLSANGNFDTTIDELDRGKTEDPRRYVFPFTIKFRATGGVEYRLKIKQGYRIPNPTQQFLYIIKDQQISKIQMSNYEFNFIFKEIRSREIEISFSGVAYIDSNDRNGGIWNPIMTEKIQIDRIN